MVNVLMPPGNVLILAGPNGVGKSSLLHRISRDLGSFPVVEILNGFRNISFQSSDIDHIGIASDQLFKQLSMESDNQNRYRSAWGEQHLKSVVKRFVNKHNQDNEDIVNGLSSLSDAKDFISTLAPRSLDLLNRIFLQARLPVEIVMVDGILNARRAGATYGIDRMSDGERAALLLVCAILIRPQGGVIAIDEPEKHLNPSISSPLLAAAVRARPDLNYIIATHDLRILESIQNKTLIHVVDSKVVGERKVGVEERIFNVNIVKNIDGINEGLQVSILGARKSALFVEGEESSYDRVIYSLMYPNHSVVGRGGWEAVVGDVRALRGSSSYHHVYISGLIDRDGREDAEISAHEADGVYSTKVPTIENVFFRPEVMLAAASARAALLGGASAGEAIERAEAAFREHLESSAEEIAYRRAVWRVNRAVSSRKVSVKQLRVGAEDIIVNVSDVLSEELSFVGALAKGGDGFSVLDRLPIKNTSIPSSISKALGFASFRDYQAVVVHHMEASSEYGLQMVKAVRECLPEIPHSK